MNHAPVAGRSALSLVRTLLQAILLLGLTCGCALTAVGIDKVSNADVQDLQHRGRALHAAVLEFDHKLNGKVGFFGPDISDLVEKFIPIGTPFSEANEILRAAGFGVNPSMDFGNHEHVAYATLRLQRGFLYERSCAMLLFPEPQHDPAAQGTSVARIKASIGSWSGI